MTTYRITFLNRYGSEIAREYPSIEDMEAALARRLTTRDYLSRYAPNSEIRFLNSAEIAALRIALARARDESRIDFVDYATWANCAGALGFKIERIPYQGEDPLASCEWEAWNESGAVLGYFLSSPYEGEQGYLYLDVESMRREMQAMYEVGFEIDEEAA